MQMALQLRQWHLAEKVISAARALSHLIAANKLVISLTAINFGYFLARLYPGFIMEPV